MHSETAEAAQASPKRNMPGESGIWLFIFGDMMVFALFFLTYIWYRAQDVAGYDASQLLLDQRLGFINTLVLLTSSWFVALAARSYRSPGGRNAGLLLAIAFVLGLTFVGIKFVEYGAKFGDGITLLTDDFFMFYFMFTGIHLIHVLIGLGVLSWLFMLSRTGDRSASNVRGFESGAAFWHLVDLLWVVLFALLYLVR